MGDGEPNICLNISLVDSDILLHMVTGIQHLADLLKAARRAKCLSQRELGSKVGLPQSHLSKIENGSTDLKLSSLVEIARALDLEPVLVPRKLIPAVQSLIRSAETQAARSARKDADVMDHAPTTGAPPAYRLDEDEDNG
jgi:HTH-type transcriptional regulator / antitoxin HipB